MDYCEFKARPVWSTIYVASSRPTRGYIVKPCPKKKKEERKETKKPYLPWQWNGFCGHSAVTSTQNRKSPRRTAALPFLSF